MWRYAVPITLGAFLLFQVQPLIGRCILPWFGGTPAVWTTCMLFFQALLLAGYAYSHLLVCRLSPRGQAALHTGVMLGSVALLALLARAWGAPLIPSPDWKPPDSAFPIARIVLLLTVAVGLPYFVLSTTSPMLQAWFGRVHPTVSPYRLYTLSNAGSLLALLTYPVLVEPHLAMKAQGMVWAATYGLFVVGCIYCAVAEGTLVGKAGGRATCDVPDQAAELVVTDTIPSLSRRWLWVALPALASVMLLATTNQMCQEVAVIPFLWVLPLSLYLLSFIICFDSPRWYVRQVYIPLMVVSVVLAAYVFAMQEDLDIRWQIGGLALAMFTCCMVCHGELVALKPGARRLTGFYLAIAVGGVMGGLLVGLLAPVAFKGFWELPIGLVLTSLLGAGLFLWRPPFAPVFCKGVGLGLVVVIVAVPLVVPRLPAVRTPESKGRVVWRNRNFYGVLEVRDAHPEDPKRHRHILVNGRIIHGWQFPAAAKRRAPTSYYSPESGVGLALRRHPRRRSPVNPTMRIGVVGLGSGSLAVYGQGGDTMRFYDINPQVVELARDPRYFTYLADCPAKVEVVLGDARISMERELRGGQAQGFDVLVLDAFSSDAIPAHLLTKEALEVYLGHLRDRRSLIVVHVSNRVLDLKPVVYGLADELGLEAVSIHTPDKGEDVSAADWMIVTRDRPFLRQKAIAALSSPRNESRNLRLWTDDFHNLFQILR